ncbi:hypothetical protein [Pseudomonas sp. PAMC 29040]|uniref:hypothetical protein n=1 Tax=Pseudomonas sp. PAMC 29040 TaxID=2498450 RepID=UPI002113CA63|nr:hypothetical protein [Pseudomonas sp. PAMC 29040]
MTKRWISEEHLKSLPARMTVRALSGAPLTKPAPAPKKPATRAPSKSVAALAPVVATEPAKTSTQRMQALGRLPAGVMNKTEEAYAAYLEQQKHAGQVLWYKFEGIKLRLADKTFYTVDFFVMPASRELEAHEVKGFWTDDARVKIKVAAGMYPVFKFVAIKKASKSDGGGWSLEEF